MNMALKKKFKTGGKVLIIVIGFFWFYTKIMWPSTFTDTPEILANLYAKELCSCHYLVGQSVERCFENHAVVMRPGSVEWNEEKKNVKVRVMWAHAEAHVLSERLGCIRSN
jgi:hypothetical protein